MQSDSAQEMASIVPSPGFGARASEVHVVPFQWMTAPAGPTAVQFTPETHEMAAPMPTPIGAGTVLQVFPFQTSVSRMLSESIS